MSAVFAAMAYVTIKYLHQTENSWRIAWWFTVTASVFSLPGMLYYLVWPSGWGWVALLGAGIIGTIAQVLMTVAYKWGEASRLSSLTYLGLIISFGYGIIFWGEIPNYISILGALFIVICCLGVTQLKFRKKRDEPLQVTVTGP